MCEFNDAIYRALILDGYVSNRVLYFVLQLRTQDSLPPFTPWLGEMSCTGDIPHFNFMPNVFGKALKKYRNTISTGEKLKNYNINTSIKSGLMVRGKLDKFLRTSVINTKPFVFTLIFIIFNRIV